MPTLTDFFAGGVDWWWYIIVGVVVYLVGLIITAGCEDRAIDHWEPGDWLLVILWPVLCCILLPVVTFYAPAKLGTSIGDWVREEQRIRRVRRRNTRGGYDGYQD